MQRDNGVRVIAGAGAKSINAENGKVSSVTVGLKDPVRGNVEEIIPAETVLVATGAQVVTDFLP